MTSSTIFGAAQDDPAVRALRTISVSRSKRDTNRIAFLFANSTEEYTEAVLHDRDVWVPACGGFETPTKYRCGRTLLYVFNPALGQHAYLDLNTDQIIPDDEVPS